MHPMSHARDGLVCQMLVLSVMRREKPDVMRCTMDGDP